MTANGVLIAGAGIGGLTAALAIGRRGIGATLFEQAEKLEEAGAGIQLSPNATRVLVALGLAERLNAAIVEPSAIRVRAAASGREIATMRLGAAMLQRYGAPYWVIHRADLQKALIEAIAEQPRITLTLGATVDNFTIGPTGVSASVSFPAPGCGCPAGAGHDGKNGVGRRDGAGRVDYSATALIGADGLWSRLHARLGFGTTPRFAGRSAFRALIPAGQLSPPEREPIVNLWIGPDGHLVHYPVRAGAAVNIVAACGGRWQGSGWNTGVGRDEVLERFPPAAWAAAAREVLAAPAHWRKWPLCDREPSTSWGQGPVTLLGDAAHPMLPFLAQGAAMAIEDAAVLARELVRSPVDCAAALRSYESERRPRTARVQREARRNDFSYHLRQPAAFIRDAILQALGGERLLAQYDWIYQWRA